MRYFQQNRFGRGRKAAVRTEIDGIKFQSKAEAREYLVLKAFQEHGIISGLKVHPRYSLDSPNGTVCHFLPDFEYRRNGLLTVHEVKGFKEEDYKLKAKWFQSQYPEIEFVEVRAK